jgi:hypothetical protein
MLAPVVPAAGPPWGLAVTNLVSLFVALSTAYQEVADSPSPLLQCALQTVCDERLDAIYGWLRADIQAGASENISAGKEVPVELLPPKVSDTRVARWDVPGFISLRIPLRIADQLSGVVVGVLLYILRRRIPRVLRRLYDYFRRCCRQARAGGQSRYRF